MKGKSILLFLLTIIFILGKTSYIQGNNPDKNTAKNKTEKFINSTSIGFEENKGQLVNDNGELVPDVLYRASFKSTNMYITTNGITYVFYKSEPGKEHHEELTDPLRSNNVDAVSGATKKEEKKKTEYYRMNMFMTGSVIKKENITAENPADGYNNYYYPHCPDGILNVKTYQKITIKSVYPGIDWVIYADKVRGLKYDFVIHPGADPENIRLNYEGATGIKKLENGRQLMISTPLGKVKEGRLSVYENKSGKKINSLYKVDNNEVHFEIGKFDSKQYLIIDPPLDLVWATYYGGTGNDDGQSIISDGGANIYITGSTESTNFPVQTSGGPYYSHSAWDDVFILKFDTSGIRKWATYYGGTSDDIGHSIATDPNGNVFITGETSSSFDFPCQAGGSAYSQTSNGSAEIFILKFSPSGTRKWATYYGGSLDDIAYSITADKIGYIYLTGQTKSTADFLN